MILSFLEPIWPIYSVFRVLIIFVDMVLFFVTVYAAVELFNFRPSFVYDPRKPHPGHAPKKSAHAPAVTVRENWQNIKKRLETGTPDSIRTALIEADSLLDNELKKRGYEGDTFADRLSKFEVKGMEHAINNVWAAHRLRNDVVHTPGFHLEIGAVHQALEAYETFLKEIDAF